MRHKLHLQEQFIREHGIHVNNIQDADQIKECVDILDRLIEDDYHSKAFVDHDKRWGKAVLNWLDYKEKDGKENDLFELKITHPKVKTEKDLDMERKDFRLACEKEDQLRRRDMRNLFLNMYRNIQGWWD